MSPTLNRTPLDESTKPSLCKIQGAEVLLPAAVPSWKTYEEALVGLEKLGFKDARFVPGFDTKPFCLQLQSLLTSLEVVDVSYALPTGPAGNHSVFPTIGHDLVGMSKRHKTRVYVLMPTQERGGVVVRAHENIDAGLVALGHAHQVVSYRREDRVVAGRACGQSIGNVHHF